MSDLEAYEVLDREPISVPFRGYEVFTNAPPSSGGILIAYCLALLDRLEERGLAPLIAAMGEANLARGERFHSGLYEDGYAERFLSDESLATAAARVAARLRAPERPSPPGPGDILGSTTHIAVIDADGMCASVTCSNGAGSGVVVPGTGVHLNNMLGEEDLNPLGFHFTPPGARITSMMAPTIVLSEDGVELALGSAGSNRIRSAILQTIVRTIDEGLEVEDAVQAGRVHFEGDVIQAEPGVDEDGLEALEAQGHRVARWRGRNLFFGGVQAVSRDPGTGELAGAGDPRRGGAAVVI
jgi:gamma-glutamyltranspeptidase/glutathione hydrolase